MAQRWSLKEDLLVCRFCLEKEGKTIKNELLDELVERLSANGFERSKATVDVRAESYVRLLNDEEVSKATNQMKDVAKAVFGRVKNKDLYSAIERSVKESYVPDALVVETIEEAKTLQVFSGANSHLNSFLHKIDFELTFPMVLLKFMDKKGIKKNRDVYKPIDMKADTFSAILNGKYDTVKKDNVLRLCVGLKLTLDEAEEFMASAGYLFSNGIKKDVVVKACLKEKVYDPFVIDDELMENNAPTLFSIA